MGRDAADTQARRDAYNAAMQRVREMVAAAPPLEDPPEDAPAEYRRMYWQMREISARCAMRKAASRRERAEFDLRRQQSPAAIDAIYPRPATGASTVRERGDTHLATRADIESVQDDIDMVAEGLGAQALRLERIEALLERIDSRLTSIEDRLTSLEHRTKRLEDRVERLEHPHAS